MQERGPGTWQVRSALREATAAAHQRLHHAKPFAALSTQQLDIRQYGELLRKVAAFHFTVSRDVGIGGARPRLLRRDLDALGTPAPPPVPWAAPQSAAAKLGLAYVVEGSALGGKLIYRQLDYLFGRSAAGRRFFRGSAGDALRWRALCRRLEAHGQAPDAVDEMIGAAGAAFALFEELVVAGHGHD